MALIRSTGSILLWGNREKKSFGTGTEKSTSFRFIRQRPSRRAIAVSTLILRKIGKLSRTKECRDIRKDKIWSTTCFDDTQQQLKAKKIRLFDVNVSQVSSEISQCSFLVGLTMVVILRCPLI